VEPFSVQTFGANAKEQAKGKLMRHEIALQNIYGKASVKLMLLEYGAVIQTLMYSVPFV